MSFIHLEKANGPPCPVCGCQDVDILILPPEGEDPWFEKGKARCRHCRRVFWFRKLPDLEPEAVDASLAVMEFEPADIEPIRPARDVAYPVRECPECGSPHTLVKSSPKAPADRPKIRYHECRDCPAKFKSVDRRHLNRPFLRAI